MSVQMCKVFYFLTPYSTDPWDFLCHDITWSKSLTRYEKGWHLMEMLSNSFVIDTIPSVFYKAILIECEHKTYFSHVLIHNYLLWMFELYLCYWSQTKKGLNGSWPGMMGLTNLPSLVQEINIWLWCEVSSHVIPPRPDLGYPFHPWLSQRGNWSKVHIHQNIFFTLFFPHLFRWS